MQKPKLTMTSREAAALLVSGGITDDADKANLMAAGQLLDPDKLERAHYRRMLGFDVDIVIQEDKHKAFIKDRETRNQVGIVWKADNNADNAARLAKAVMKLKRMHDALEVTHAND